MALWKQLILSALVLIAALMAWVALVPGASGVLDRFGLSGPMIAVESRIGMAPAADPAAGGGQGQKSQGQTRGGLGQGGQGQAGQAQGAAQAGGQPGGQARAGGGGGFARGPALVVVRPATSAILNDRVAALGTGTARASAALTPKAAGTLTEVAVRSGDRVTAGQVMARLDAQAEQIAFDKAKLANADAQTTLDHDRQLVAAGTMPASQLQAVELAAKVAALNLASARNDLDARQVTAPFDGIVGLVTVNPGMAVTTQTTIATLEDTSRLILRFALPERLVGQVKPGDAVDLVPVARPDLALKATISAIDTQVDAASGTFQVEADLPNPDGMLVSGMTFALQLRFPGQSYTAVDPLAIQWGSQGAFVWRLKPDSTVEKVMVRIVQRNTDAVLVAGDLAPGDPIVTEGLDGLRDGATVQVAGQPPEGQGGQGQAQPGQNGQGKPQGGAAAPGN